MQEDKEAIFDAVDTVEMCLTTFTPMLDTMKVLPEEYARRGGERLYQRDRRAPITLWRKGMPFRDAYRVTGDLVARCLATGNSLETLPMEDYKAASELFDDGVYDAVRLERCVEGRRVTGGPSPEMVREQIAKVAGRLKEYREAF